MCVIGIHLACSTDGQRCDIRNRSHGNVCARQAGVCMFASGFRLVLCIPRNVGCHVDRSLVAFLPSSASVVCTCSCKSAVLMRLIHVLALWPPFAATSIAYGPKKQGSRVAAKLNLWMTGNKTHRCPAPRTVSCCRRLERSASARRNINSRQGAHDHHILWLLVPVVQGVAQPTKIRFEWCTSVSLQVVSRTARACSRLEL